jgi:hypothetical protein
VDTLATYITVLGDTWDKISYNQYGTSKFIKELMEANYRKNSFSNGRSRRRSFTSCLSSRYIIMDRNSIRNNGNKKTDFY